MAKKSIFANDFGEIHWFLLIFIDFEHVINMYFYQWESLCVRKSTLLPPNIKRDIKWGAYLYNLQVPFTKTSILQILNSSQIRWLITMTSFSMNHTVSVIWPNYFWKKSEVRLGHPRQKSILPRTPYAWLMQRFFWKSWEMVLRSWDSMG